MTIKVDHYLCVFIFFLSSFITAQIPVGEWRDHLPYSHATRLAYGDNKVYCITDGGMFYYDTRDNSINRLSKINGLSDIGFSSIGYDEQTNSVIIGYSNGNIDIISNNTIYNLPDLKQKQMVGDKTINSIFCENNYAYLSCGFGIIVINLTKKEIKDTYKIAAGGTDINVNAVVTSESCIYAATDEGLYKADINTNLLDSKNWYHDQNLPYPNSECKHIVNRQGYIYISVHNSQTYADEIYMLDPVSKIWEKIFDFGISIWSLRVQNGSLLVVGSYSFGLYDANHKKIIGGGTNNSRDIIITDNIFWIASNINGLIRRVEDQVDQIIFPEGPAFINVNKIDILHSHVWVGSGTFRTKTAYYGVFIFREEEGWTNINQTTNPELTAVPNFSRVAIHPYNSDLVYGGSPGYGLVELNDYTVTNIFDQNNSTLRNVSGYDYGYINVTGLCFDNNQNLYVLTTLADDPLSILHPNGEWELIDFGNFKFGIYQKTSELLCTKDNYICFLLTGGPSTAKTGLMIVDYQEAGNIRTKFIAVKNQEAKVASQLSSLAEDLDGNIWVGTNEGPFIYYNFTNIFKDNDPLGNQIVIPRNDGTILGDPLLGSSLITDIEIDGANRKWFGTKNAGLFLISEDGMEEIHHFDEETSPLFSNTIIDVELNHETGEVFIATDKGMLSYRGDATMGGDNFKNVYVFPNPIRENYKGDITITGLARNANVKITDISGNMVYETTAKGGQVIWSGKTLSGDRVHTGVYLIFCTNEDGSQTHISKLLFIN